MDAMDNRRDTNGSTVEEAGGDCGSWVVLATGPSVTVSDVAYIKGRCKVAAVSDAFRLAPWADILVSHDRAWWEHNKDAKTFKGRRFCAQEIREAEQFKGHVHLGRNSGLMAMCVARFLGAKRLFLLGFDMKGTHFFGPHPAPLKNSTSKIFATHLRQFDGFSGCDVVNCTPNSALTRFPLRELREVL